jgi:hypothetical protein
MQNLIKQKTYLLAACLVLTLFVGGCNGDTKSGGETSDSEASISEATEQTTFPTEVTESETGKPPVSKTSDNTLTAGESNSTPDTTSEPPPTTAKPTDPSVTTPKATTPPVTTPKATQPPKTEPPITTPKATDPPKTDPPVAIDPQVYVDYAIEYGQSIGLEYKPKLNDLTKYGYEDDPLKYCSWDNPIGLTSNDENMKLQIRSHCNTLLKFDKAESFRVEVYHTKEVNWLGDGYLLFIFYA